MSAPGYEPRKSALLAVLLILAFSLAVALGVGWMSENAGDTGWEAQKLAGGAFIATVTVLSICVTIYYLIRNSNR
ncbi:hypothetical protein [Streptomyces ipomoeae]|uniref:hypothetical protein n=1 Tax=Streptomyces ipomoeae TaxID=103232 RepID=UPI0011469869|nr:hypothetical protein [Streptomyces ipomoeae]MDX2933066.1 hypothetical protein [Streptomyces ipomoeae]TQE16570.1 hypothetical protein SipoB123_40770 [Streptomyces ipomoeae]